MPKFFKVFVFFSLFFPLVASAGLVPCSGPDCTFCDLLTLVINIVHFAIYDVLLPLAGLLILIGGIMMMLAGVNENYYKKGKEILKNTVIGLVIVLCSWVLVNVLIGALTGNVKVDSFDPSQWWNINCTK